MQHIIIISQPGQCQIHLLSLCLRLPFQDGRPGETGHAIGDAIVIPNRSNRKGRISGVGKDRVKDSRIRRPHINQVPQQPIANQHYQHPERRHHHIAGSAPLPRQLLPSAEIRSEKHNDTTAPIIH
jgi:hypothetical protein